MSNTSQLPSIFVSHSHQDSDYCHAFVKALRDGGADVWYDESDLAEGELLRKIQMEIYKRPVFIVVLSEAALNRSNWVNTESQWGYGQYMHDREHRRFLPVTGAPLASDDFGPDWVFLQGMLRIEVSNRMPLPPQEAAQRVLEVVRQLQQNALKQTSISTEGIPDNTNDSSFQDAVEQHPQTPSQTDAKPGKALPHLSTSSVWLRGILAIALVIVVIGSAFAAYSLLNPTTHAEQERLHWRFHLGNSRLQGTPTVANGIVYFATEDGQLYALHENDGSIAWSFSTHYVGDNSFILSNGLVFALVFALGKSDYLYALRATDGSMAWKFHTGENSRVSEPAVIHGIVYFIYGGSNSSVYALHATDGSLAWRFPIPGNSSTTTIRPLIVFNDVIYFVSSKYVSGEGGLSEVDVYALYADDGTLDWSWSNRSYQTQNGFTCASDGIVYTILTYQPPYDLIAFRASNGSKLWTSQYLDIIGQPTFANGFLYFYGNADDESVFALHASTGSTAWKYHVGDNVVRPVLVSSGILFTGSLDGYLHALNASSGSQIWKFQTGNTFAPLPAVANGMVYVGTSDSSLNALYTSNGSLAWKFQVGGLVTGSPSVVGGVVYVTSGDGYLYAIFG